MSSTPCSSATGWTLVAVWVHSADKSGRDVGDLLGVPATGVRTTRDLDDVIAEKADCAVYTASGLNSMPSMCRCTAGCCAPASTSRHG